MKERNGPKDPQGSADLRLVEGGLHRSEEVHGVLVVHGPERRPPFPVEAVVAEEDTRLVLSTPADAIVSSEHPVRVMTEVHASSPLQPGSVVVRPGMPLRFLAVVHDLDQDPTWCEAWVVIVLDQVLQQAEARGLEALGLPMIGTLHGSLPAERFLDLLGDALRRAALHSLRRIWLISGG